MRLGRGIGSALLVVGLGLAPVVSPRAATIDDARGALGFGSDASARSVRLLGLGGLTLPGDDPHNRIDLWDFALNPLGLPDADSVSTFELRPGTSSASAVADEASGLQRQEQAGRESRLAFEGWRRAGGVSYGAIGDVALLRLDQPFTTDLERRTSFQEPNATAALTGPLPYVKAGHARYSIRAFVSREVGTDEFRTFVQNASGSYLDGNGQTIPPTNFFDPDEEHVTVVGGGLGASMRLGTWLTAGVLGDLVHREVLALNSGARYSSEVRELQFGHRPYPVGQATLVGKVGKSFSWGWDGRLWSRQAEERWEFTVSAGIGQDPLTGRGKYAVHEERGESMRARARWVLGGLEVGGSLGTDYLRDVVNPPGAGDPTSFNTFLDQVFYRPNADTLALPDSAAYSRSEMRAWTAAGGLAWRLGRRALVGAEYHAAQSEFTGTPRGLGPRPKVWDVRAGLEYQCTPVLAGRAGFVYRKLDRDELTASNEQSSRTMTLGFGVRPAGATWGFDAGYALEWWQADYGDPAQPRGNRQNLTGQVRWTF